jgi:hypothetical protein
MNRTPIFCAAFLCALSSPLAWAGVDLGNAGNYTVLGMGSGLSIGSADTVTANTAEIYGNVGVGAATISNAAIGNGTLQKGFIQGNLYVDGPTTPATYDIVNKNFTISGTVFGTTPANPGNNPDSVGAGTFDLVPAVQDAINRSSFYASVPGQSALGNFNLNSANMTLAAGNYSATSFLMNSGSILTINGSVGQTFVLNDSGDFSFAKSFIQLTGGITAADVLFNITGPGTTVTVSGDNSIFFGNILAVNRNITVDGLGTGSAPGVSLGPDGIPGTADDNPGLEGRVIGALSTSSSTTLDLIVHSGAEINQVPEPTSLALLGIGASVFSLLLCRRKTNQTGCEE